MEKMRKEFEAYCERECLGTTQSDGDGDYFNPVIGMLWHSWKSSRAALCVKLPENCKGKALTVDEFRSQLDKEGVGHE